MIISPTSCPLEIYKHLHEEVSRGDKHSLKIKENKIGILRGAEIKQSQGVINEDQKAEIAAIIDVAETIDFRPLVYVVPYDKVSRLVRGVAVSDRAHPLSEEYIIENLPRATFDVIEFAP